MEMKVLFLTNIPEYHIELTFSMNLVNLLI